jgi:hypothetical protein
MSRGDGRADESELIDETLRLDSDRGLPVSSASN